MEIKVYATLRAVMGGKSVHLDNVSDITVAQMLQELYAKYPTLRSELFINNGDKLHPAIHILINGRDMRYINGMETIITIEDDVRMFPPVGGGY